LAAAPEGELVRLSEAGKFAFLYEVKQAELRRICSVAKALFGADRAQVVMVESDHLKALEADGVESGSTASRKNSLSDQTVKAGRFYEIEDILDTGSAGPRNQGARHYAAVPLRPTSEQIVGVFAILTNRVRRLSAGDRENLIALAHILEDEMRLFQNVR